MLHEKLHEKHWQSSMPDVSAESSIDPLPPRDVITYAPI